jgi:hypothetical protein
VEKIRNRLVNFRVTEDELERLKTASALKRARCLSEFARSVVLRTADDIVPNSNGKSTGSGSGDDQMLSFDRRLTHLESHIVEIMETLRKAKTLSAKSPD